jgi:hypothetical protein
MRAFPQMSFEEQGDHLLHVHGLADAEELIAEGPEAMEEAHTWQHGTFESDHQADPHEDDEAMTDRYVEIARPYRLHEHSHECNEAHERIWHDGDVRLAPILAAGSPALASAA